MNANVSKTDAPSRTDGSVPLRLGILTFHSQLNYGGVLQAFALQEALREMGEDAIVMDKWLDSQNWFLLGQLCNLTPITCLKMAMAELMGCDKIAELKRRKRTVAFLREHFRLSPYHFCAWEELRDKELGLDCLVVGSDQVWRCEWREDPRPFLLEGVPSIKAISYAASFGMTEIPQKWQETYRAGFARFSAISVRERSGVGMVRTLGFEATEVLDPTQLVPAVQWRALIPEHRRPRKPVLACYFVNVDLFKVWDDLEAFARKMGCEVHVLFSFHPFDVPRSRREAFVHLRQTLRRVGSPVHLHCGDGPLEFLKTIDDAEWVLGDSFHGLMFASLFDKNVRVLPPPGQRGDAREGIFARILDFADAYVKGPLIAESVAEALASFERGERVTFDEVALEADRERSRTWLRQALDGVRRELAESR